MSSDKDLEQEIIDFEKHLNKRAEDESVQEETDQSRSNATRGSHPFRNLKVFSRSAFLWIMNWDIKYMLPLASTWISTDLVNWVTRFYLKLPF